MDYTVCLHNQALCSAAPSNSPWVCYHATYSPNSIARPFDSTTHYLSKLRQITYPLCASSSVDWACERTCYKVTGLVRFKVFKVLRSGT